MSKETNSGVETPEGNSRATRTRAFLTREVIMKNIGSMNLTSPLLEVYKDAPEGYEYGWLRETFNGELDSGNLFDKESKGWQPVPASRHPHLFFATKKAHGDAHDDDGFRYRGLRLYERLLEYSIHERKTLNETAMQEVSKNPALGSDSIRDMGYKHQRRSYT